MEKLSEIVHSALDYKDPTAAEKIRSAAGEQGVQVFVDVAASQNAALALQVVKRGGCHAIVGPGQQTSASLDLLNLIAKGVRVCGVALYNASVD